MLVGLTLTLAGLAQSGPVSPGNAPPAAPPPVLEQFQTFDPFALRVAWQNRRWQIVSGQQVVKDFGSQEQDARQALRLIQELRLNQRAVIGGAGSLMEYWLTDGQAPARVIQTGLRGLSLDPGTLRVEDLQGQWCVRDKQRILFNFAQGRQDAEQALAVLKKYHFDEVTFVGQTRPVMYVFTTRTRGDTPTLPTVRGSVPVSRQLQPNLFSRQAKNADGTPKSQRSAKTVPTQGLDGMASPLVPPLAAPAVDRRHERQGFEWRSRPQMGQTPTASPEGDRLVFDWRQAVVAMDQGEWKLKVGSQVIANFGQSAHDARMALGALRHYRFNEQHRLGGPDPYLAYFVTGTTSPRGMLLGLQAQPFNPDQLEVRQLESGYALCQGPRVVLRLRDREDDGRKLLETIKRHRCDRLCQIGDNTKEPVTLLIRSH
jgi:hypothetical protein